jgi:hypothetical protein
MQMAGSNAAVFPESSQGIFSKILKEHGVAGLWRGTNAKIYYNCTQMAISVLFFDKMKHIFMPYDPSKY